MQEDFFRSLESMRVGKKEYVFYRLSALEELHLTDLERLPFSIRIMLEAALRQCNDKEITQNDVKKILAWNPAPPFSKKMGEAGRGLRPFVL